MQKKGKAGHFVGSIVNIAEQAMPTGVPLCAGRETSAAEYLTYVASIGGQQDSIDMRYEDENIWLTQKMMAMLYDVDICTINEHIKKIYSDSNRRFPPGHL